MSSFDTPNQILSFTDSYPENTCFIISEYYDKPYLKLIYRYGQFSKALLNENNKLIPYTKILPKFVPRYIDTPNYPSVSISGYLLDHVFLTDDMAISCRRLFRYSSAINTLNYDYGFKTVTYKHTDEKYLVSDLYHYFERYIDSEGCVLRVDDLNERNRIILPFHEGIEKQIYRHHKPVDYYRNIDIRYLSMS